MFVGRRFGHSLPFWGGCCNYADGHKMVIVYALKSYIRPKRV